MLSRKLHIEQVTRLHDKLKELSTSIDACANRDDLIDYRGELALQYFKLSEVQMELDNFVEMKIKHTIDFIDEI